MARRATKGFAGSQPAAASEFSESKRESDSQWLCASAFGKHFAHAERGCTGTAAEIQHPLAPKIRLANVGRKLLSKSSLDVLRINVPSQRLAAPMERNIEESLDYIPGEKSLAALTRNERLYDQMGST